RHQPEPPAFAGLLFWRRAPCLSIFPLSPSLYVLQPPFLTSASLPWAATNQRCSMSSAIAPLWWDRESDGAGRPIRPDVRTAAHKIWNFAYKYAESFNPDSSLVSEAMENAVAQISRYLDIKNVATFSRDVDGLLMLAFQRSVRRHRAKVTRLETL